MTEKKAQVKKTKTTNTIHKMTQNEEQFKLKLSKVADRLGL